MPCAACLLAGKIETCRHVLCFPQEKKGKRGREEMVFSFPSKYSRLLDKTKVETSLPLLPSTDPTFPHAYLNPGNRTRVRYCMKKTLADMEHARSLPQNTPEWLAQRSGIIMENGEVVRYDGKTMGASRSAAVVGWSSYVDPRRCFWVDTGNIPPPIMGKPAGEFCFLRHGHEMEEWTLFAYGAALATMPGGGKAEFERIRGSLAREGWNNPLGRQPLPFKAVRIVRIKPTGIYYSPEVPYLHASVDGVIFMITPPSDTTPASCALLTSAEAKSPVFRVYESIPVQYIIQMMHQKLVVVLSFMDEFTLLFAMIREEMADYDDLLPAFDAFVESLSDGKDKAFAKRLFEEAERAAKEGRSFTATDVADIDGSDIEFMAAWWANPGNDRHSYTRSEGVCGHLRVWRIKYNHSFALALKSILRDYVDAVNEDPPDMDDPRVWPHMRESLKLGETFTFQIARVVEAVVISQELAVERGADRCVPFFTADVKFPFYELMDRQLFVRDEDGAPWVFDKYDWVRGDSEMFVKWWDETDFREFTFAQIEAAVEGIKMSSRGPSSSRHNSTA